MKITHKIIAALSLILASSSVSAAVLSGNLQSDPGEYTPFALGTNLELTGCGTTVGATAGSTFVSGGSSYKLCDLSAVDIAKLTFTWSFIEVDPNNTNVIIAAGALGTGRELTITTGGATDLIKTAGTYKFGLNVTGPISSVLSLPGGDTGVFTFFPAGNTSTQLSSALVVSPAPVPEPATALLLLPALMYMGRRKRQKDKAKALTA